MDGRFREKGSFLDNPNLARWENPSERLVLIFWDLLFLLEYMSVLYEMDDSEGGDEE